MFLVVCISIDILNIILKNNTCNGRRTWSYNFILYVLCVVNVFTVVYCDVLGCSFLFYTHCELDECSYYTHPNGEKFSLSVEWLYLRMAWSYAWAASVSVSKVPRHFFLPFTLICAWYLPDDLSFTPRNPVDERTFCFFLPFGSLLRLCFMVGKFNHEAGRRCLWTAWSYATAACLRVLK